MIVKREINSPMIEWKIDQYSINEIKIEKHSIENDIMEYQQCVDSGTDTCYNSRDTIEEPVNNLNISCKEDSYGGRKIFQCSHC